MKLVGFGSGGHAKVLIDALRLCGHEIVILTDPNPATHGRDVCGVSAAKSSSWRPSTA